MPKRNRTALNRIAIFSFLSLAVALIALSGVYSSSFLAILGLAIIFWAVIIAYITPESLKQSL